MSASGSGRLPAGPWGCLACGRAAGGGCCCWKSVPCASAASSSALCPTLAVCFDKQLGAFAKGWRPGSIRPLKAEADDAAQPPAPYVVDVLGADTALIASFACPLEAIRYAALLHEPGCTPRLRRRWDGALKVFSPAEIPGTLRWLQPERNEDRRAR